MQGMRKRMSHYDPSQPSQSQWQHPNAQIQTEWQQPPSQPLSPQSFDPRPPKKKARSGLWVTIGAVAAMLALLGFAIGVQNNSRPATSTLSGSSKHRPQPTLTVNKPSPQPTLIIQTIGKPVVVDSIWTITVNGVKTSA